MLNRFHVFFLRFADDAKAYRLYDINTRKIVTSRDVIFFENEYTAINSKELNDTQNIVERITIDKETDTVDINPIDEVENNETIDSGEIDNDESTVNNEPLVAENENVVPDISADNSVESIEVHDRSTYEDTIDTSIDDGGIDTSSEDPTFKTRARAQQREKV